MADYKPKVRLSLTQAEANALLAMATEAEAGDLNELLGGKAREVAAALRATDQLRDALHAARQRTAGKAARKHEEETRNAQ